MKLENALDIFLIYRAHTLNAELKKKALWPTTRLNFNAMHYIFLRWQISINKPGEMESFCKVEKKLLFALEGFGF